MDKSDVFYKLTINLAFIILRYKYFNLKGIQIMFSMDFTINIIIIIGATGIIASSLLLGRIMESLKLPVLIMA
ncbi:hypothetical protein OAC89_03925 [Deltaproteobacteria bacterium]|nr:hypothetical protein [Deltaproteobacteria bacterium]